MSFLRTIACVALALAVLASCGGGGSSDTTGQTLDASKITPGCFQGGTVPELQIGSGFSGADWNDPHVIKVGPEYWLYASSNLGFPPTPPSPVQIYRFTSTDAVNWTLNPATPVLTVSAGQWDQGGVETPALVFFGGKYHMFWTGYPDPWPNLVATNFRIGHATSLDGITWTKDPSLLLGPSAMADFRQYIVGEPGPVVFNNTLYLYFTAVGFDAGVNAGLQTIGVMTSSDGIAWSAPTQAFKPDQSVYPRAMNWVGYSTPNAVVIAGKCTSSSTSPTTTATTPGPRKRSTTPLPPTASAAGPRTRRPSEGLPTSPGPRAKSARRTHSWTGLPCGSTSLGTTCSTPPRGVSGR